MLAGLLNVTWALSWLATAAALTRVIQAGQLRSHRWLIFYLGLRTLEDPVLFPFFGQPSTYIALYIGFELAIVPLLILMAAELYRNACLDYPGLGWVATWTVNIAGAIAILLWVASLVLDADHVSWTRFTPRVLLLGRSVATVLALFFVMARLVLSRFPFRMRTNTRLQFNVFTLYLAVVAITFAITNIYHDQQHVLRALNIVKSGIFAALLFTLAARTTKQGEIKPATTSPSNESREAAIRRMEAWSAQVRQLAREAGTRSSGPRAG